MLEQSIFFYQVLERLGEGGMGVVCKARDTRLDRFIALKVLRPEAAADPERKRHFVQEAKAASALNHPNIVTVYDISSADGVDYIAMELVPGRTIEDLLTTRRLKVPETLKYAVQIADALAAAHATRFVQASAPAA